MSIALTNEVRELRRLVSEQQGQITSLRNDIAGLTKRLDAMTRQQARGQIKIGEVPRDERAVVHG